MEQIDRIEIMIEIIKQNSDFCSQEKLLLIDQKFHKSNGKNVET